MWSAEEKYDVAQHPLNVLNGRPKVGFVSRIELTQFGGGPELQKLHLDTLECRYHNVRSHRILARLLYNRRKEWFQEKRTENRETLLTRALICPLFTARARPMTHGGKNQ